MAQTFKKGDRFNDPITGEELEVLAVTSSVPPESTLIITMVATNAATGERMAIAADIPSNGAEQTYWACDEFCMKSQPAAYLVYRQLSDGSVWAQLLEDMN